MEKDTLRMTRKELYEQVWTLPLTDLAKRYGLTNVELARLCDDHEIPRPLVGHWSKIRAGKVPQRIPLRPVDGSHSAVVDLTLRGDKPADERRSVPAVEGVATNKPVTSPEPILSLHPFAVAARDQLVQAKPDESRRVRTDCRSAAFIHVAPSSIGRAVALFNTLIHRWREIGGEIKPSKSLATDGTLFVLEADSVPVALLEQVGEVSGGRKGAVAARSSGASGAEPSGRFSFCIQCEYGCGIRATWSDCAKFRLEDRLHHVVKCVRDHILYLRQNRLDAECGARQKERAEACREARERRKQKDKSRLECLNRDMEAWHAAQRVRGFATAVQAALDNGTLRIPDKAVADGWLTWARWHADVLDPLVRAGPCPDHPVQPSNVAAADFDLTHRTREVVAKLGVKDADDLSQVTEEEVRKLTHGEYRIWSEITTLLEGLGYDVPSRHFWSYGAATSRRYDFAESLHATE